MRVLPILFAALIAAVVPVTVTAQDSTKPKPDSARMGGMSDHMMGPWKEMNAFHSVMGATWHPASARNDLAPLKARAKDLATAAEAWLASKPPVTPASCGSAAVKSAVTKVVTEAKGLVALLESGADDDKLKAALKKVHDEFEVAEHACGGHG